MTWLLGHVTWLLGHVTWLPFPGAQTGGIRAQFENLARAGTEDAERQAAEEKERRRKREAVERQMEKEKVWMAGVWASSLLEATHVVGSGFYSAGRGRAGMGAGARTV